MGELMRSIDWSKTALGPLASWPQSLRTTVSTCLSSRFPILVWWGPEFVKIYNDAYRQIVGAKHPASMGARGRDVWPEIWDIIGPMLEGVLAHGRATWSENQLLLLERHGFAEECYFTFSYSPIHDESGRIGGIFSAITETTGQVLSDRRLRTLRELAEHTAGAKSAGEACASAARVLRENSADLPFGLLYLLERGGTRARLAGESGEVASLVARPAVIELAPETGEAWPFSEVVRTGAAARVDGLRERFGLSPAWLGMPVPDSALVLPIGLAGHAGPAALLVAGLSPRLALSEDYRGFFDLVGGHVATAIASARALEEVRARAEALAQIDRAKTTFFSNVSHEFRTPLTLMLGPIEDALARPHGALDGEALHAVHRSTLRLLKLVNALLDFSRIEAGRARAAYRATDLGALTADLASSFRSAIERAGIRFEVECAPLPEPAYVDRDMWEKIVLNLLSNAFKFTFEGEIRVALCARAAEFELRVSDTGAGIAASDLPRIFERFHRVEGTRARTHEGSGIGLALVYELVRLHGGQIRAASELGRGTVFTVTIPRGRAHLPEDEVEEAPSQATASARSVAYAQEALRWLPDSEPAPMRAQSQPPRALDESAVPGRVLIADDNADMRMYLTRLLAQHWEVRAVADGAEALAFVRKERPDLVLADVMMPNLDGFGLIAALRADPEHADLPVILLSARAGDEATAEGLAAGANDYMVKPFSTRELTARVQTQLVAAKLRRSEEDYRRRLQTLFEHAPVAIALLRGPDHVYEIANARYLELVGERSVLGRPVREALSGITWQSTFALLDGVYRSGIPYIGRSQRLQRGSHAPEECFFDFVYQPVPAADGSVEAIIVAAFDVTELARARSAAEAANRTKDEFLAMLGHELRNPLAPITTAVHLLKARAADRARRELVVLDRQVGHLTRLVDDLLDVSRITRGKVELKRERVELGEVLGKAIEMAGPLIEQRGHELDVHVPGAWRVWGDPFRLSQVFANLLTNAAKYTERAGHITVSAERRGDEIAITVSDDGMGVSAEMLPRLFELFSQERQALDRSQGGLGLGLAIVKSLVQLHGGTVSVQSRGRNLGSTFTVRLPSEEASQHRLPVLGDHGARSEEAALAVHRAERASAPPQGAEGGGAHASDTRPGRPGVRVLVVDDNRDAAELLAQLVESMGHSARLAHDGPTALQLVSEFRPELALVDIGLPVMDGYELVRQLRKQPGGGAMQVVAVTGYGLAEDVQRSREAGFDAHIVKPVQLENLEKLISASRPRASS